MLIPQWSLGMILGLFARFTKEEFVRVALATAAVLASSPAGAKPSLFPPTLCPVE